MKTADKIKKHFGSEPIVWINAWGVSKLRKRGGTLAGAIAGNALWYDEWYDRVMSRETAGKFAELGVNIVALPFSLGADGKIEKAERDDFKRMTGYLHEFNIKSVPYIQYQNILQETSHWPGIRWAVNLDGRPTSYNYWRRTACQSGSGFIDYFKDLISDAVKRGADGVYIDNEYLKPCKCEACANDFKGYLRENGKRLIDELYFDDFDNVEMPPSLDSSDDPIVQAFLDFNCERNLKIHVEMREHLEKQNPYGLLCVNPALWRGNSHYKNGVDFQKIMSVCDLAYIENKLFPGMKNGSAVGNYHCDISADACGSVGVPGAWKKDDFDTSVAEYANPGFPENKDEIDKVVFEAVTFNAAIGMLWSVRTMPISLCSGEEDLMKMYFEWDGIYPYIKKDLDFVRTLPIFGGRKNISNIAVLYHRESIELDHYRAWPSLHMTEEFLLKHRLPYNVVFSEKMEDAMKYKLVILPYVSLLSDAEAAFLREYVKKGGKLLSLGMPGTCDERKKVRKDTVLKDVLNASVFNPSDEFTANEYFSGKSLYIPAKFATGRKIENMMSAPEQNLFPLWADDGDRLNKGLLDLISADLQVKAELKGVAGVSLSEIGDGRKIVQIFSYEAQAVSQKIRISVHRDVASSGQCEWVTPDNKSKCVQGVLKGMYQDFELPDFKRYGIAFF
jgi:hypothetical protein